MDSANHAINNRYLRPINNALIKIFPLITADYLCLYGNAAQKFFVRQSNIIQNGGSDFVNAGAVSNISLVNTNRLQTKNMQEINILKLSYCDLLSPFLFKAQARNRASSLQRCKAARYLVYASSRSLPNMRRRRLAILAACAKCSCVNSVRFIARRNNDAPCQRCYFADMTRHRRHCYENSSTLLISFNQ